MRGSSVSAIDARWEVDLLTPDDVRQMFEDSGALLRGHFLLSSGRHSGEYWEKFRVLQWPQRVEALCREIARRFAGDRVDVVLGPTTGGILLALETARQMGSRALYAEQEAGMRVLRRGFALEPGTRTLIVDDILTLGGSLRECLDLAHEHGAAVVGAAVLVDRSGGAVELGTRLESLLTVSAETYSPEQCPLCAGGIPIRKPGTKQSSA